jgi:putative inorganic carbon (hco3(-)) transporter
MMERLYSISVREILSVLKSEGWAFMLICLYLFFEYVRPQSIYTNIDILPWGPIILVLTAIAAMMGKEFSHGYTNLNDKFIIIYGVVVLLSSMMSEYPDISLVNLRVFFDWLFIYYLITKIVTNERRLFVFLLLFLLCSFKMSQHGFLSWARADFVWLREGVTGAPGWFHNSGEVGIQMCIYVPMAIAFMWGIRRYVSKIGLLFFSLMPFTGVGTVMATSSRGAMFGLGMAGVWSIMKKPKHFILGGIILSLVALAVFQLTPAQSTRRFQTMGGDPDSVNRLQLWSAGTETMNRYPFLGVGFEAWTPYYRTSYQDNRTVVLVHNVFVQCGSELGYTGLFVFVLMIGTCFRNTRQVRKIMKGDKDRFLSIMSFGFDSALMGFLASGFFVTVLYYPYFWIHCALVTCLNTAVRNKYALTETVAVVTPGCKTIGL